MSRSRTRERRMQREQERKRQRQMLLLGSVVVVAVLIVVFLLVGNQPAPGEIPEEALTLYEGLEQSLTDEGYPILGNAAAPVQVVEYSSFDCPSCAVFEQNANAALVDRVRAGEISLVFAPVYGTGGIANGEGAARAAYCVAKQGKFWEYHNALFSWQRSYANTAFTGSRLAAGVDALNLDRAAWDACMASDEPDGVILSPQEAVQALPEFGGTPTITVNGTVVTQTLADVNNAINVALANSPIQPVPVVEPTEETTEEATDEATEEATEEASE